jgi:DNA primase large subunit
MTRYTKENGQYAYEGDEKASELAGLINSTFSKIDERVRNQKSLKNAIAYFTEGELTKCLEEMRHVAINNHVEEYYQMLDKTEIIIKSLAEAIDLHEAQKRLEFIERLDSIIVNLKHPAQGQGE